MRMHVGDIFSPLYQVEDVSIYHSRHWILEVTDRLDKNGKKEHRNSAERPCPNMEKRKKRENSKYEGLELRKIEKENWKHPNLGAYKSSPQTA